MSFLQLDMKNACELDFKGFVHLFLIGKFGSEINITAKMWGWAFMLLTHENLNLNDLMALCPFNNKLQVYSKYSIGM